MDNWTYNEFKHSGVDYSDTAEADRYDKRHQSFRDFEKEFNGMLDFLKLRNTEDMILIDLGCGTGETLLYAARKFKKIYAVDVSKQMLSQAQTKIQEAGITNIDFVNSGFLNYNHKDSPADLVMTKAAFHHLPDFWKQVALLNMNKMLKPGGILYMFDVVFHFNPEEYSPKINNWLSEYESIVGKEFITEFETHIRDEYSTFNWVLEGMFTRAGFTITESRRTDGFMTEYYCKKIKDMPV